MPGKWGGSEEQCCEPCGEAWKTFLIRHWKMFLFMIAATMAAAVVALFVFLGVVADAQTTGLVPVLLGEWTVGICIAFILNVILWELVFVASWAIPLALILYFVWYKNLPAEERKEYEGPKHRKSNGDSVISFFAGLIWLAIVWTGGKWDLAFQAWTFNDWVYTWLTAYLWILLIVGIPGTIYVLWALSKK